MNKKSSFRNMNYILLFLLLLFFWHVINAGISVESLIVGTVGVIAIFYLNKDIIFRETEERTLTLGFFGNFFVLIVILLVEILKSNIAVAKVVLAPKMPINPIFVKTPVRPRTDFNKVLYGNIITLTPGTLTIDITEEDYLIHALNDDFGEGMEGSTLEEQVLKLEVKKK